MIKSMTGYGKGECTLTDGTQLTIEIRTLNGKSAEINIKGNFLPKEREMELRKMLSNKLVRGNIDVIISQTHSGDEGAKKIDKDKFLEYYKQIDEINNLIDKKSGGQSNPIDKSMIICTILRLPDVIDTTNKEIDKKNWNIFLSTINDTVDRVIKYRETEGKTLQKEMLKRVGNILKYLQLVKKEDIKRVPTIKERLISKIESSGYSVNMERLEQELVYYIEKIDITEEKVRLEQHCNYFIQTIDKEDFPGKKLGFILQEMGREINTTGSKANDASIQKWVVKMKDELEKMKEQSLNIL